MQANLNNCRVETSKFIKSNRQMGRDLTRTLLRALRMAKSIPSSIPGNEEVLPSHQKINHPCGIPIDKMQQTPGGQLSSLLVT
jgi:hypothetical protein